MILGHFSTALIPKAHIEKTSILWFLFCSNLSDFLWIFLSFIGIEDPKLWDFIDYPLSQVNVNMFVSHDLIPLTILAIFIFTLSLVIFKTLSVALCSFALVIGHWLCDLLSGYEHYIFGKDSYQVGLALYRTAPVFAIFIESLVGLFCVIYYLKFTRTSVEKKITLLVIFVLGPYLMLPITDKSLRDILSYITGYIDFLH